MPPKDYYLPPRQLTSQQDSAIIQSANVPRSKFHNQWGRLMTFNAGWLVPFMLEEVLPGDHLSYDVTAYVRMSTPLFPVFSNQRVDTFFFFVPWRLVWVNWVKMMGEQTSPGDSIAYTTPTINSPVSGFLNNSIYDHMGIPGVGQTAFGFAYAVNALPFRAYALIFNTWFRDQNLSNPYVIPTDNGPDASALYTIGNRAKSHDYFTSCLPWPQKFTAPTIPLSGNAEVRGIGVQNPGLGTAAQNWLETGGFSPLYANAQVINPAGPAGLLVGINSTTAGPAGVPQIYADLSTVTGIAINQFRQAIMVQSLLERDARGGTRYTELIKSHFGVVNPDFRLQRPEYIGGGQSALNITPIAQTAPTAGAPLGALGGTGTAAGQHRASYAATEHGCIIGIINVRSELYYQQGLPKIFSRATRYDYYWPAFAGLGEQAVLVQEIYKTGDPTRDSLVFGYQERWHEYRTRVSEVTGMFRSTTAANIDEWHLGQHFTAEPALNSAFIQDSPPMDRILSAGGTAQNMQYLADIQINRVAVRPIPTFGTPATLGRF